MPAEPLLRERLKALVEEWRKWADGDAVLIHPEGERFAYGLCAKQLSDRLAESDPNPGQTHYQGDDCPGGHASVCGYCGAKCERCAPVDWSQPQELVITADGPLEPEPPLRKARKA